MARYLIALLMALVSINAQADEPLPVELPPDQEAAALKEAEATGLAIYRHDHAAAVATDAALKIRAFKKDKRVRGWITEEQDGLIAVTFIEQSPAALYRVVVSGAGDIVGDVDVLESPQPLTEFEAAAVAARSAAIASEFQPCSDKYNSVVLPSGDDAPDKWTVYLLPGTTKGNVVPIGGTYRMRTVDGAVVESRGFTRTCIALQSDPGAAGMMITHLLDSIPTEAHVFWSLWARSPLYVATPPNGTIWSIESGEITLVKRGTAKD
ncbi:hypothetical protein [Marilutibacter alkalisoli]|uniref:PepSY domain-containing protein n=1 Tax=Marilutibacter alkalisoli TaxID=2591633 RepID=A0A514BTZ2_9GAMM|nr:hypothetical protein [Lysobacter alkalisoli]QDH70765.1 hypothetical protein FKV23_12240 [Lysobacter alkalisoli]